MKISARNQWKGVAVAVKKGAVMAEVVVRLEGGQEVVSAITLTSVESLGIQVGSPVIVVVKATEVMLASPE
jgi:molybdate transport system regulatory protein